MDDELPEILIKYIPRLENAINIFSKEALKYYFNDFFDNEYKSKAIVDDYVDDFLTNKSKIEKVYRLLDNIEYEERNEIQYIKMYKNRYKNKEELLIKLFNNPFNFKDDVNYIDDFINVINKEHYLKIGCDIPKQLIQEELYLYKTNIRESLYSKLHSISPEIKELELEFKDNDFDYVNDMMKRYGKDIENMKDDEYDKIEKCIESKNKNNKIELDELKDIIFWDDNINNYITKSLENYDNEEIIEILNRLSDINLNINDINVNIFSSIKDLYKNIGDDNIDIETVYDNANNYLKKKEIERLLMILTKLKNNENNEINELIPICNNRDKVFINEYKFEKDLIEIIDNEDEDDHNEKYTDYGNIIKNIGTQKVEDETNLFEKSMIREISNDLNIDIDEMLEYMNNFSDNKRIESMLFYLYFTIQTNFYNNQYEDLQLNNECINYFYEYEEPIKIEDLLGDPKVIFPKNKSIYSYIKCCFMNISTNTEHYHSDKDIEKKLKKLILTNESCKNRLFELKELYEKDIYDKIKDVDSKFYKKLVIQLKNADNDIKYINYVRALKYIVPKSLGRVNNFISGCCPQLLNQDFEAYNDIIKKQDQYLKYIQTYYNETLITYEKNEKPWEVTTYLPEEIENNDLILYKNEDDEDDNIDNYNIEIDDDEINKYLENQSLLNIYVKKCVKDFMMNVINTKDHFSLERFIIDKCNIVHNLKILLLAGCLEDSTYFYDQIAILENSCCNDINFTTKRKKMYIYLSAKYLTYFNSDKNTDIFERIKNLSSKTILTREEYNKSITDYREKLKVEAINILENLSSDDKEVAMMLKQSGIIKTYDDYNYNNDEYDNDPVVIYKGDDNNDQSFYD